MRIPSPPLTATQSSALSRVGHLPDTRPQLPSTLLGLPAMSHPGEGKEAYEVSFSAKQKSQDKRQRAQGNPNSETGLSSEPWLPLPRGVGQRGLTVSGAA